MSNNVRTMLYEERANRIRQARALAAGRLHPESWKPICAQFDPIGFDLDAHFQDMLTTADLAEEKGVRRDGVQIVYRKEAEDVRKVGSDLNAWRKAFFTAIGFRPKDEKQTSFFAFFKHLDDRGPLSPRAAREQVLTLLFLIDQFGGAPDGLRLPDGHVEAGRALSKQVITETEERDAAESLRMWLTSEAGRAVVTLNNQFVELEDVFTQMENLGITIVGLHLGVLRAARGRAGGPLEDEDLAEDPVTPAVTPDDDRPGDGRPDVVTPPVRPVGPGGSAP